VTPELERLVDSLLYEGYALYPYTPGALKNATPTPFGIVYPPAYAERTPGAHDRLRVECVLVAGPGAAVSGDVRFLQYGGPRHQAVERRLAVPATPLDELAARPVTVPFSMPAEEGPPLEGRLRMRVRELDGDLARVALCVHNTTALAAGEATALDRPGALGRSLLSTHVVLTARGGRFVSPLEREGREGASVAGCENVNTWPVLATPEDDAILAAAIVLPDHPRIAPESVLSMFDGTEIEEALLLHVQALSDGERAAIEEQDPAVRAMLERASAATPEELRRLHGRTELAEPGRGALTVSPPAEPAGMPDPRLGEAEATVDGRTFRPGARVVLRPGEGRDPYDRMLAGRPATIQRIFVDVDGGVHLGVVVDEDPLAEVLRDSGRLLFFRPGEVEEAPA